MAWWDDLGSTLPPQQQAAPGQQPAQGGGGWNAWLQDPVNQAGLLSFGLQMMTGGGHGGQSFGQQLATGLSHGFAGAQATSDAIRKQQELDEEQARKAAESAAELSSRERIAEMSRASREEVARTAAEARMTGLMQGHQNALALATHKAGLRGAKEMTSAEANKLALEEYKANLQNLGLNQEQQTKWLKSRSDQLLAEDKARRQQLGVAPEAPAGPTGAAAPQAAPGTPGAPQAALPQKTFQQVRQQYGVEKMKDPALLQHLEKNYPHMKKEIDEWKARVGVQ